jgi:hypothetical protein
MPLFQRLLSYVLAASFIAVGCSGGRSISTHVPQETQETERMNLQALGYQHQAENLRELARANELEALAISMRSEDSEPVARQKRARVDELRAAAEEAEQKAEEAEHGLPSPP